MSTILALGFPLVAVGGAWALFRPGSILQRLPRAPEKVDRSPLPYRTYLAWTLPILGMSFGLGWLIGLVQHALLSEISGSASWTFSHRVTDLLIYAFVPGLFVGMLVSFPVYVRALHWHYGDRLIQFLDRRGRDRARLSLRQEIVLMPILAAAIALAVIVLNVAAFDTFLQVGTTAFRFSYFFSPRTVEYPVSDIQELAVYSQRIAPNGRLTNKRFLEVRMRDSTAIDTYYLIEEDDIPRVIEAMQKGAGGRIPIRNCSNHK